MFRKLFTIFFIIFFIVPSVYAHFGTIIPSDDIITQEDNKSINLEIKFIHPMEMHYMEMEKPVKVGVMYKGKMEYIDSLTSDKNKSPDQTDEFTFWKTEFQIKRPGDYTFFVEPKPYWEPAEDCFIIHYAKVCVNTLGLEAGWDDPVGLETEIIPLTRPYGLWTGNIFTGKVLVKGKVVPNAEVEVEYLNESIGNISIIKPPADPYITQVVKADSNGIFSYAMPKAGWWGFAALNEADFKIKHDDQEKGVEIGAVYWVKTIDMK
ncbi:MAG: DUF4198 domain-containing protein [Desulfobacterales bacterium]|nr:DUF4198 domain-containing protein [Desulfobacterales bacterium]